MLYVVTVALDNYEYTQRLIDAIGKSETQLRVVVIDNGSADGTVEKLIERYGQLPVVVLPNVENLGASAAWNMGIRFAMSNGADKILVCGNDTMPLPDAVDWMAGLLDKGVMFVTGTAIPYDSPIDGSTEGGNLIAAPDFSFFMFKPVVVNLLGQYDAGVAIQAAAKAEDGVPPAIVMGPWDWGLFDTRYGLGYFEDNDFHIRAKKLGIPLLRDPGALWRHDVSLTIRTHPEIAQQNEARFKHNAELFAAKWGGLPQELEVVQARPANVTDEQWKEMCGGHEVVEVDREAALAQAKAVYAKYGVEVAA